MWKLIAVFTICYILPVYLNAQIYETDGWDASVRMEKPKVKLDRATGRIYDFEKENWVSKRREIVNLDNFDKLEFGTALLDGKKYLYLRKTCELAIHFHYEKDSTERWTDKDKNYLIYMLDPEQYKTEMLKLNDDYNVLYLDILEKQKTELIEPVIYPANMSESDVHKSRRANEINEYIRNLNRAAKLRQEDKIAEMQKKVREKKVPFRDRNKLIIKFEIDENREKVRFFIFEANTHYMGGRYIPQDNFFQARNVDNAIEIKKDVMDIMWSDEVFDYFYFEAGYKEFMGFIQAPLQL
ncbi:MAG: hypothetical protein LBV43_05405 [Prevotella sp.]|jgi:hypothetical protein|nr:hypothetical protein [Prevotella sp.]